MITIALAVFFRLNKSLAFLCSNISIPPMIPLIVWGSLKVGSLVVGGSLLPPKGEITKEFIANNLLQYLTGSIILAALCAFLLGGIAYLFLKNRHHPPTH